MIKLYHQNTYTNVMAIIKDGFPDTNIHLTDRAFGVSSVEIDAPLREIADYEVARGEWGREWDIPGNILNEVIDTAHAKRGARQEKLKAERIAAGLFVYDDGGRAAAGMGEPKGDCSVRAIAIATGLPYDKVHKQLSVRGIRHKKKEAKRYNNQLKKDRQMEVLDQQKYPWYKPRRPYKPRLQSADCGTSQDVTLQYMQSLGWKWTELIGKYVCKTYRWGDWSFPFIDIWLR